MTSSDVIEFNNASLILIVNNDQAEQQVWRSVQTLSRLHCRTEVILVVRHEDSSQTDALQLLRSITYRPFPKMFPCLKQAIEAAKHPLIAIADAEVEIDPTVWNLLKDRSNYFPIQTAFHSSTCQESSKRSSSVKRLQLGLSGLITRTLLRTGKSELRPGLTMINRDCGPQSENVSDQPDQHETSLDRLFVGLPANRSLACSTQLIALARLNGFRVSETDLGVSISKRNSNSALPPESRTIRRAVATSFRFWWNTMMFPRQRFELQQQLGELKPGKIGWPKRLAIVSVLMMIAAFCLFNSLGFALFEPDEARNAQLALNVVESGDWLSLKLNQEPYWDKPPLQIWAIAASYQAFGVNQWSTRLPGVVAALLTILMTALIGKRLVGFRAAAVGTFLLLLTTGFLFTGRYVTMDATLTATTTATLLLGFLAVRNRFRKPIAVAAGIACGLGVLTKGPIAIVLCLPPLIAANWLLAKQPDRSRSKNRWLWFLIPTAVVSAPWFIATSLVHPDFLNYFFWKHHLVRFSSAFNHREPFWYYAIGIFLFMFPASYLLPSAVRWMTSRRPENRLWRTREHGFLFLAVVWIIGFFTLSESKLPTYIVPSFPLICLLMGALVERKLLRRGQVTPGQVSIASPARSNSLFDSTQSFFDGLPRRAPLELVFWIAVGSVALLTMFPSASVSIPWMIVSASLIGLLSLLAVRKRSKPKLAWVCFGSIALFATAMIVHRIVPAAAQQRSIHIAAQQLKQSPNFEDAPLVFFGREPFGSTLIHDPADVKFFKETQTRQLVEFLTDNPAAIIVASEEPMKTLRSDLPWTIRLDQCENARHLYTSQINRSVAEIPAADGSLNR